MKIVDVDAKYILFSCC